MSRPVVALIVLATLTFLVGLGRTAITDSDEGYYAESAREMVERGDWLTPHFNAVYRFEKPVLYYWLAAIGYVIYGVSESAARLPSALAGLGLVLVTFAAATRWHPRATGTIAGAIAATSFGYVAVARQSLPDLLLAFFVVLSTWTGMCALVEDTVAPRARRWWMLGCAAAAAGAFLTKGPVGIALPGIVLGPLMIWRYGPTWTRWRDAVMLSVAGAIVFSALASPWYVAMVLEHGPQYLTRFFIGENLERFATDRYNEPRALWYYLPIIAGGLAPWTPFMALWLEPLARTLRRTRRLRVSDVYLIVWALAPLLFYTLSVGKQPRYILPVLPPLAILLAGTIQSRVKRARQEPPVDRWLTSAGIASGLLFFTAGWLVYRMGSVLDVWSSWQTVGAAVAIVMSGVGVSIAAVVSPARRLIPAIVAGSVVATLALQYSVLAPQRPEPVERMAAMVLDARQSDEPYGRYRVFTRNLVFYTGVPHVDLVADEQVVAFLRSPGRVLCVLTRADLRRLTATAGVTVVELGEVSYVNLGNLKLRTFLRPNPSEDVQQVVLVANR